MEKNLIFFSFELRWPESRRVEWGRGPKWAGSKCEWDSQRPHCLSWEREQFSTLSLSLRCRSFAAADVCSILNVDLRLVSKLLLLSVLLDSVCHYTENKYYLNRTSILGFSGYKCQKWNIILR